MSKVRIEISAESIDRRLKGKRCYVIALSEDGMGVGGASPLEETHDIEQCGARCPRAIYVVLSEIALGRAGLGSDALEIVSVTWLLEALCDWLRENATVVLDQQPTQVDLLTPGDVDLDVWGEVLSE